MAHINIDGVQNVEVSKPIPSEKTPDEQLRIMELYTETHRRYTEHGTTTNKARREIECLKVLYPTLFRSIQPHDLIAGRLDFLPIGFGSVTSLGGVGHYCVFHKLRAFKQLLATDEQKARIDALYDYWQENDTKSIYCQDVLGDATTGFFMQYEPPFMATARLSGMMLDYRKLMCLGVAGLIREVQDRKAQMPESREFLQACEEALQLFQQVLSRLAERCAEALEGDQGYADERGRSPRVP